MKTAPMPDETQWRLRAIVLFVAPVVLLAGFALHPYLNDETDAAAVAEAVMNDPDRWASAHLILVIALGLALLSVFAVRQILRASGEERWSFLAVPLIVVGGGAARRGGGQRNRADQRGRRGRRRRSGGRRRG